MTSSELPSTDAGCAAEGREIKVYDDSRTPRDWNLLLKPWQCAVFFRRVDSEAPLSAGGTPFANIRDTTFLLFDRLETARAFCERKVQEHPGLCGEIFDNAGKAKPPLLAIVHPKMAAKEELSASAVRNRKILAVILILCAVPLFWYDWRTGGWLVVPTFLGITMILAALRLLYWNLARRERMREQQRRIEEHLARRPG